MSQPTKAEFQKLSDLVTTLDKGFEIVQKDVELAGTTAARAEQDQQTLRDELANLRIEVAVLRQKVDDHIKQVELWDSRRWGLIVVLIGAVLSLASGLIVTLANRR